MEVPMSASNVALASESRCASPSRFLVGRDSNGRWTALRENGLAGGVFKSQDAAIRYAQSEAARTPGSVRMAETPLELDLDNPRIGKGRRLPAWWRLGRSPHGASSAEDRLAFAEIDRPWLAVDLCLTALLALLCVGVGMVVS
jgi:hypothetical protein